jgi:hypothetical protein
MNKCLVLVILFFLQACTCTSETVKSPHWGQVACAHCRMAVSEKRNAAQLVGTGYRVHYYDDLGCALLDQIKKPELASWKLFVLKDPDASDNWSLANELKFSEGNLTPMGYGFSTSPSGTLTLADVIDRLKKTAAVPGRDTAIQPEPQKVNP